MITSFLPALLSTLLVTGRPASDTGKVYSRLWGVKGELWDKKKLPDFTRAGYGEGRKALPKYPVNVSITDFGGSGDGKTDNTAALRKAIAQCGKNGAVFIPEGTFLISDSVHVSKNNICLRGAGKGKTILHFTKGLEELYPDFGKQYATQSNWSWSGGMILFDGVSESGIEQLSIAFPDKPWVGHDYHERGYNGVGFARRSNNCWLSHVNFKGCDQGLWIESTVHHITAENWSLLFGPVRAAQAVSGHHGVNIYGGYNLLQHFTVEGKYQHDLSVEGEESTYNVFRDGRGKDLCIDHHNHKQRNNLFTSLDMGEGRRSFFSGGISVPRGISFNETYWGLNAQRPMPYADHYNSAEGRSAGNICVGIKTDRPAIAGDADGNWFETINPDKLYPADLYQAQMELKGYVSKPATGQLRIYPKSAAADGAWNAIAARAQGNNEEAKTIAARPLWQQFFRIHATSDLPYLKAVDGFLANLPDKPLKPRFRLTGKVWPVNPGEASICLWEDDKTAAASISIDDNNAQDLPHWKAIDKQYGGLNLTWFLITGNIDGSVQEGMAAKTGTWALWQQMTKNGFHLESHSATHVSNPVLGDGWPGPDWDMGLAVQQLDANLPGQRTRIFAPPGSALPEFNISPNWRPGMATFYAAARGFSGVPINPANQTDYFDIRTTASPAANINGDTQHVQYTAILDSTANNPYYRGWATVFTHGIYTADLASSPNPQISALAKVFTFFNENRKDIWIGAIRYVALYGQERDMSTVTTSQVQDKQITIVLTSRMDPRIFDYPLTLKVCLPQGWHNANCIQSGQVLPLTIVQHNGYSYALVKARPNWGDIIINKHSM